MTKSQQTKVFAWKRQSAALASIAYRLTLVGRGAKQPTYNVGKRRGADGGEKLFTAPEIAEMIPFLSYQNAQERDVYILPIDQTHHHILVDDMTAESLARLRSDGHTPAIVQESSAGNWQAVLRVASQAGSAEPDVANRVAEDINKRYGDPAVKSGTQPFRMAGFSNKKPGRANAFTRLIEATGALCARTADLFETVRAAMRAEVQVPAPTPADPFAPRPIGRLPAIAPAPPGPADARHDAIRQDELDIVAVKGWDLNQSTVDYRVSRRMLRDGFTPEQIAGALERRSPDIGGRHKNTSDYVSRTIDRAGRPPGRPDALNSAGPSLG